MFKARDDRGRRFRSSYWDVRWSWSRKHELAELTARFRLDFEVIKPEKTRPAFSQSLLWEELTVKADNLSALLSAMRACLFQKHVQPFTARDRKLQSLVYELYPFTGHFFYSPIHLVIDLATKARKRWGHATRTELSDHV